ncbi:RNA polymerase sigma factor [Arthrobacter cavernae]|uniref:RNA polymerase sigma factor n=1 Tax=Arthrobacter cavernae TaxID=2817681 RepID=UPI0027DBF17F|nr:sigma-70 family RNA polymerase sigma factor [Arthrobacter cavernae]
MALHKDAYPRVYNFVLRRVNDEELAQELAADVFRVAWEKWEPDSPPSLVWLLSVARNVIGNAYRGRERQRQLNAKLAEASRLNAAPGGDASPHVHETLDTLRPKDRDILQLAYWDELSLSEIAAILGCTDAAAKVRLHRAREAFRRAMPAASPQYAQAKEA